ncbi:CD48 antigen isoform X2 [Gadus morhua]|uniref:CD48 antigen isoform X2 n=1 Tax=Gadus morhua TaxID=8049 RepID=UPI0011B7C756|nr:CD48 antigen-like isoform X2 [Gadus morhua]
MWLPLLFFQLLRVVGSNQQVLGFLGGSVTLSPALDVTQRNISSIKWLILSNDTWIATYQGGKTKTNHFWQYRGRLHLDISSGDLTIKNLIRKDAMKYVLEVGFQGDEENSRKFVLRVEQRLAQPLVTKHHGWSEDGSCILRLQCFSPDPSVNFTWSTTPPATNRTLAKWLHPHSAFLLATMGEDDKVGFTCNTTTALESASHTLDVVCGRGENVMDSQTCLSLSLSLSLFLFLFLSRSESIQRTHSNFFSWCSPRELPWYSACDDNLYPQS